MGCLQLGAQMFAAVHVRQPLGVIFNNNKTICSRRLKARRPMGVRMVPMHAWEMVLGNGSTVLETGAFASFLSFKLEEDVVRATIDRGCTLLALHSWLHVETVRVQVGSEWFTKGIGIHSCRQRKERKYPNKSF